MILSLVNPISLLCLANRMSVLGFVGLQSIKIFLGEYFFNR